MSVISSALNFIGKLSGKPNSSEDTCCGDDKKPTTDSVTISKENQVPQKEVPSFLSDCLTCLVSGFSSFINILSNPQGTVTVKDLDKSLDLLKGDVFKDKQLAAAFEGFKKAVDTSAGDGEFAHKDISNLIQEWNKNEETKVFLAIAHKVMNGDLETIKHLQENPQLKEGLTRLFNTYAKAIEDAKKNGGEEKVVQALKPGMKCLCHSTERLMNEKPLEQHEKEKIRENVKTSSETLKEVAENPELNKYLSKETIKEILETTKYILEIINELFEDDKTEEEKREEEKLQEERTNELTRYRKVRADHEVAKKRYEKALAENEIAKRKLNAFLADISYRLKHFSSLISPDEIRKLKELPFDSDAIRRLGSNVSNLKEEQCEIACNLPTQSACGLEVNFNDLDITC